MKTKSERKHRKSNCTHLSATGLRLALLAASLGAMGGLDARGQINGTINGSTSSAIFGDDTVTTTTIGISYFTYCPWIATGAAAGPYGGYNFVFAGQGVASGIPNISSSDFTVSQYAPWVGNNNGSMNSVTGPDGGNYNRSVTNLEAGGANIVISYTPKAGDPTNVNFLQAFSLNFNGNGGASSYTLLDNGGNTNSPFYNYQGVSGVGTNSNPLYNPNQLRTSSTSPGWLLDIPWINEYGYVPPGADETITNATDYFQTFISSQQNINGTNYNVLYGGIQWGFSFSTLDVPEPASAALACLFVVGAVCARRGLRHPRT